MKQSLPTESRIKREATSLRKNQGIKQAQALNLVSQQYGFSSWQELRKVLDKRAMLSRATPQISMDFIEDDEVSLTDEEYDALDQERYAELKEEIRLLIERNKKTLVSLGVEFSLFEPTLTGLKKSILDATQPVRTHFELVSFHDYAIQQQGPEHKVKKVAYLLSKDGAFKTTVSLYRPVTKSGDPRMWFSNLAHIAEAGDQVAIIIRDDAAYLVNLSTEYLDETLKIPDHPFTLFVNSYKAVTTSAADELLKMLSDLARAPFPAERSGSTGIGYTLEKLLGITANSSKLPDYKGIELKSGRSDGNRTTLFAQVADWGISPCKSSAEILDNHGYQREEDFKLYCTLSALKPNSQGLHFKYDPKTDQLQEWYYEERIVAIWPGSVLRSRLKEKHTETFWIQADSSIIDGVEHFQLKSVTHTRAPILSQLIPLLVSGVITMDHLIKRSAKTNKVSEKGPLFKMNKRDLDMLFPKPLVYSLV
ncbi:MvaI/BcnI family restriction endonuclease [Shewanella mangrovisoli]|uniref:MvaI/BcnI family restriction endonuclease n=1 Tax=Shewanella mangrovisoli TaxID=2864211 RepID=UPI0035B99F6A